MSTTPPPNVHDPLRTVRLMRKFGVEPDPWQADVLTGHHQRLILNCCRQAGKSTAIAFRALADTLFTADTVIVLVSRSLRQSTELSQVLADHYARLDKPLCQNFRAHELKLANRSRVICLPCKADTVRGLSGVDLLNFDEAARVPDNLYRTVRPMLAISKGRLILLSTPCGRRGFFYDFWANGDLNWHRIEVPETAVPRIGADHLAWERREPGESWFRQEYCCSFEAM